MTVKRTGPFSHFGAHLRRRIVSGLLVVLPLGITYFVVRFGVRLIADWVKPLLDRTFPQLHPAAVLSVSLLAFLLVLYLLGMFTAHVIGRKFVNLGEFLLMRVPLIRSIYGASKQVVQTFGGADKANYRFVALFDFPREGMKALGFVTGEMCDHRGVECYRIFMPTAPNPTSGFVIIVAKSDVVVTDLSVEETVKMIISGGIIGPERIGQRAAPVSVPPPPAA